MKNIIHQYEQEQIAELTVNKVIPAFRAGDTVKVNVRIIEGTTDRIQSYEGVVIGRKNAGISSSFAVRKISHGEGVERKFMLYSPLIVSIIVIRCGSVRRAKLYYLRDRSGKAARIKEKRPRV